MSNISTRISFKKPCVTFAIIKPLAVPPAIAKTNKLAIKITTFLSASASPTVIAVIIFSKKIPVDELVRMICHGEISDGKTQTAVLKAAILINAEKGKEKENGKT